MLRELAIAFRARATWFALAVAALLVGHGFVLAVDLFSSASRTAITNSLQAKEMDPLVGIVRPTLGGVDLALALLGPIVAARVLSIEKERRTFGALCLQVGSTTTVVVRKALAAWCAAAVFVAPAIACVLAFRLAGGHVDVIETTVAIAGEVFHLSVIVAVAIAAAAWTSTFAQAATVAVVFSLASWMIDSGEGFAALAWLGKLEGWSIDRHVGTFQHGIVRLGSVGWLCTSVIAGLVIAIVGARIDWPRPRRVLVALALGALTLPLLFAFGRSQRAYDWTEERRASLPPNVVDALRSIRAPIAIEVRLDRDDSRRRQLDSDTIAKILLARPDATIAYPLDDLVDVAAGVPEGDYGLITIHVGDSTRETRSTIREEIVTAILDRTDVDWTMPPYPGFPLVVDGPRRTVLLSTAYGVIPLAILSIGLVLSRRRVGR